MFDRFFSRKTKFPKHFNWNDFNTKNLKKNHLSYYIFIWFISSFLHKKKSNRLYYGNLIVLSNSLGQAIYIGIVDQSIPWTGQHLHKHLLKRVDKLWIRWWIRMRGRMIKLTGICTSAANAPADDARLEVSFMLSWNGTD